MNLFTIEVFTLIISESSLCSGSADPLSAKYLPQTPLF